MNTITQEHNSTIQNKHFYKRTLIQLKKLTTSTQEDEQYNLTRRRKHCLGFSFDFPIAIVIRCVCSSASLLACCNQLQQDIICVTGSFCKGPFLRYAISRLCKLIMKDGRCLEVELAEVIDVCLLCVMLGLCPFAGSRWSVEEVIISGNPNLSSPSRNLEKTKKTGLSECNKKNLKIMARSTPF